MRTVGFLAVAFIGITWCGSSYAQVHPAAYERKVHRVLDDGKELKQSLRSLQRNRKLKQTLGRLGESIELGTHVSAHTRNRGVFAKHVGWGDVLYASVADRVERTSKLMLTSKGVEVHHYDRVAPVKRALVDQFVADLNQQFAAKRQIQFPNVPFEHDAYGPRRLVSVEKVRFGLFGGKKLQLATWKNLTAGDVLGAVNAWGEKL